MTSETVAAATSTTGLRARLRALAWNPVLHRELTERWRGRRAMVVLVAYLGVLAGITGLLHWVGVEILDNNFNNGGLAAGPMLGRYLFENIMGFVLLLVLFITPGYAAAQISGERERQTLSLLQVTLVSPARIAFGKLGAASAWVVLLVIAATPIGAVSFFLGGVSLPDVVRGLFTMLVMAVAVAAIGLGISSMTRRVTASIVLTYATVMVLVVGSLFGALVEVAVVRPNFDDGSRPTSLYINPFYGLSDSVRASRNQMFGPELPSILTPFAYALPQTDVVFMDGPAPAFVESDLGGGFMEQGIAAPAEPKRPVVWPITLGLYTLLGALGMLIATRRLKVGHGPPRRHTEKSDQVVDAGVLAPTSPVEGPAVDGPNGEVQA